MGTQVDADSIWSAVLPRLRQYLADSGWNLDFIIANTKVAYFRKEGGQQVKRIEAATVGTIGGWLVNDSPPVGVRLIKLWHLLDALGYESPELYHLNPANIYYGQLVAYGIMDLDEFCNDVLDGTKSQNGLKVLRGQEPMAPKLGLKELKELYDEVLAEKVAALPLIKPSTTPEVVTAPVTVPAEVTVEASAQAEPQAMSTVEAMVPQVLFAMDPGLALAVLAGAALPLARHLLSDDFTKEQRSEWRKLAGTETVFALSNAFGGLCGETARREMRQ